MSLAPLVTGLLNIEAKFSTNTHLRFAETSEYFIPNAAFNIVKVESSYMNNKNKDQFNSQITFHMDDKNCNEKEPLQLIVFVRATIHIPNATKYNPESINIALTRLSDYINFIFLNSVPDYIREGFNEFQILGHGITLYNMTTRVPELVDNQGKLLLPNKIISLWKLKKILDEYSNIETSDWSDVLNIYYPLGENNLKVYYDGGINERGKQTTWHIKVEQSGKIQIIGNNRVEEIHQTYDRLTRLFDVHKEEFIVECIKTVKKIKRKQV